MNQNGMRAALSAVALSALGACAPQGTSTPAASATTQFDGRYVGTSVFLGGNASCQGRGEQPVTIVIRDGHARMRWAGGTVEGGVAADGDLGALRYRSATGGSQAGEDAATGRVSAEGLDFTRVSGTSSSLPCNWRYQARRQG